jgi:hypothetical protein
LKPHRARTRIRQGLQIGLGWYSAEQWLRLVEASDDRSALDASYADWQRSAEEAYAELQAQGYAVRKLMVRVDDLKAWCQERARPVNAAARAEYVAELCRMSGTPQRPPLGS